MDYCGARFLWNLLGTFWYYDVMDMLFELVEICHIFGGLLIEYLVDLPSSNKQVGIASAVTILAVFAINFGHLRKSTAISTEHHDKKYALFLTLPLLLMIGGSIGMMLVTNNVEPLKPAPIIPLISKITSIIGKIQTKVDSIELAKWEWKDGERLWLEFSADIEAQLSGLLDKNALEAIRKQDENFRTEAKKMKDEVAAFKERLRNIDSISVVCDVKEGLDAANFDVWVNNTLEERTTMSNFTNGLKSSTNTLKMSMQSILKNGGNSNFVKRILQNRLNVMKNLLDSIRTDLEKSESHKVDVHQNLIEKMPMLTYGLVVKATVNFTCAVLIVLASIGIVSIIFYRGTITSANRLDDTTDLTTFVTIVAGIILLFSSIGWYGTNECTLKNNFGARNFLTPFVYQGTKIEVCPRKDDTIFGFLEKEILPFHMISQNLGIDDSKKNMIGLLEKWISILKESNHFGDGLENLKKLDEKLYALLSRNCSHLDTVKRNEITAYLDETKPFIDGNSIHKNAAVNLINNTRQKANEISPVIHESYANISASLVQSVDELTRRILSADASCKLISNSFARTRSVICHAIENEMANYKTNIFVFLAGSVVAVVLEIAVLRIYSFFFVDFGDEEDDSDSESEE